jgi:hypothetical protein
MRAKASGWSYRHVSGIVQHRLESRKLFADTHPCWSGQRPQPARRLEQDRFYHAPVNVGKPKVTALVAVR